MEINIIVRTKNMETIKNILSPFIKFTHEKHGSKGPWHYSYQIGNVVFELYPEKSN